VDPGRQVRNFNGYFAGSKSGAPPNVAREVQILLKCSFKGVAPRSLAQVEYSREFHVVLSQAWPLSNPRVLQPLLEVEEMQ
jgi:hypothetical protein